MTLSLRALAVSLLRINTQAHYSCHIAVEVASRSVDEASEHRKLLAYIMSRRSSKQPSPFGIMAIADTSGPLLVLICCVIFMAMTCTVGNAFGLPASYHHDALMYYML